MNGKKPPPMAAGVALGEYVPTPEEIEREQALTLDNVKDLIEKLQKRAVHIAGRYPQKADFVVAAQLGTILGWVRVAIGNTGANLLNIEAVASSVTGTLIARRADQEQGIVRAEEPAILSTKH